MTDISDVAVSERKVELMRCVTEEIRRPFDLAAGPLSRAHVIRIGDNDQAFVIVRHHVVCGGDSGKITARDIGAA